MDRRAGFVAENVFYRRAQKWKAGLVQCLLYRGQNHIHDAYCRQEKARNKMQSPIQHIGFCFLRAGMLKSPTHRPILLKYVLQQSMKKPAKEIVRFVLKRLSLTGDESIK